MYKYVVARYRLRAPFAGPILVFAIAALCVKHLWLTTPCVEPLPQGQGLPLVNVDLYRWGAFRALLSSPANMRKYAHVRSQDVIG